MLPDEDRHVPVRLKCGGRAKYAEGGLAVAADDVRGAGRYGDDMVVHVNKREFEEMMQRWGEPTINPETGLPEFFLGDLWDGAKDLWNDTKEWIVPIGAAAAGAFLPGIGSALGSALPGLAGVIGQTGMQALGTGLLGAGAGYLANGGQGALLGGLGGALGAYGGDWFTNGADSAVGGLLTNLSSGVGLSGLGGKMGGAAGAEGGMGNGAILPALVMAGLNMAGGLAGGGGESVKGPPAGWDDAPGPSWEELPKWENKRRRKNYSVLPDYTQEGEREYFEENRLADGGPVGYANGGKAKRKKETVNDGRSDNIKALLSPGEYVLDSEFVALIGNGDGEAGAAKLDEMREIVRKHKGSALAYGQISPDALHPIDYLKAVV
jgi:hypothetical protein